MTYVMSDIHGMYDKYIRMLDLIGFSDDDDLYIIGDVVDRGDKSAEVLLDMMKRPNVYPIIGNHELMALNVLDVMFNGANGNSPVPLEAMLGDWLVNGGAFTLDSISKLSDDKRLDVLDYLSEFTYYETVDINSKTYIMVHSGFENFRPERRLPDYSVHELVWHRPDPEFRYFDDECICRRDRAICTGFQSHLAGRREPLRRNVEPLARCFFQPSPLTAHGHCPAKCKVTD
ncbi:MAG: metallophosphoesterase [Ruminiclostridium sp.]|nr:metallophosphoesterase [Ruminiclostridium sp.]